MPHLLRVLFLAANPANTTKLGLDEEARAISAAIQNGRERDSLDFRSEWAVRTSDLQQLILNYEPQILHFGGHGGHSPGIIMGDPTGRAIDVDAEALAAVIKAAAPLIRVVVLNACTSLPVIRRFANVVDYAVGMDKPISDISAIYFSAAFYGALASGRPVHNAFEWGIARLKTERTGEANTPRLLTRKGLPTPPPPLFEPSPEVEPTRAPPAPRTSRGTIINAHGSVGTINSAEGDGATFHTRHKA